MARNKSVDIDREELLLDEIRIQYNFLEERLRTYERNFNNIFLMATATLSVLLLILTAILSFIKDDLFSLTASSSWGITIILIVSGTFVGFIVHSILITMRECTSALRQKKAKVSLLRFNVNKKGEINQNKKVIILQLLQKYRQLLSEDSDALKKLNKKYLDAVISLNWAIQLIVIAVPVIIGLWLIFSFTGLL